jgi:hypothetical protein
MPVIYNLNIEVSGEGTTAPQVGSHTYNDGESVDLSATAAEGWVFDKWIIGTAEFTDAQIQHTVAGNITITAVFVEIPADGDDDQSPVTYTLTVAVNGSGGTDPEPGDYNHVDGTTVNLRAISASGWAFDKWIVNDLEIGTALISVLIEQSTAATAIFTEIPAENGGNQDNGSAGDSSSGGGNTSTPPPAINPPALIQYALTIAVKGEGTSNPLPGEHRYDKDYVIALSAKPAAGWGFEKWTVDGVDRQGSNINLTMDAAKEATAHFFKIKMGDITGSGTINVSDVTLVARHTLGISALTGAQLEKADVNGDGVVNVLDVTLIMRYALGLINSFPVN